MFLARRMAALDSAEPLRRALPRAVGNDGALSFFTHLSALAHAVVVELVFNSAPDAGRDGDVLARLPMDGQSPRREHCGCRLRVQWRDYIQPHLAQLSRG